MQTSETERHWWNELSPLDARINTAGVPPYDVEKIGSFVLSELMVGHAARILDLGCGLGRLTTWIADRVPDGEITAVDISETMIKLAERRPNIVYRVGDGRTLPESCGTFDGAYAVTLFQHLPPDAVRGYLTDVHAHLRPEARFVFNASIGTTSTFLQHDLTDGQMADLLLEAGFLVATSFEAHGWTWFIGDKA
jgi:cyclopropane fatty-acyl-phospholipid synthase-like methyltransferase